MYEDIIDEIKEIVGDDNFSFTDLADNYGNYGWTDAEYTSFGYLVSGNAESSVVLDYFKNIESRRKDAQGTQELTVDPSMYGSSTEKRTILVKDKDGNPVINEEGTYETKEVDAKLFDLFPDPNFEHTFISSLTQLDFKAIQDAAIESGYIDEEDLGNEINGNAGTTTTELIWEILNYVGQEYEKWYEGSPERSNFKTKLETMKGTNQSLFPNINTFFGGVDIDTGINDDLIISKEIFANALVDFLDVRTTAKNVEERKFDLERAKEIRATTGRTPVRSVLESDFEDLYYSLYGEKMSDKKKAEIVDGIFTDWSPYVKALIAQDESIRNNEVMRYFRMEKEGAGAGLREDYGGYVKIDIPEGELKPEFMEENPITAAADELRDEAQAASEFSQEAQDISDTQSEYMKWLLGR